MLGINLVSIIYKKSTSEIPINNLLLITRDGESIYTRDLKLICCYIPNNAFNILTESLENITLENNMNIITHELILYYEQLYDHILLENNNTMLNENNMIIMYDTLT